jgi:hypothetical protein
MDASTRAFLVMRDADMEIIGEPFASLTHALKRYLEVAILAAEEDARAPLRARIRELEVALLKLANEAHGFVDMADPQTHGHTNIAVLRLRVKEARAALGERLELVAESARAALGEGERDG